MQDQRNWGPKTMKDTQRFDTPLTRRRSLLGTASFVCLPLNQSYVVASNCSKNHPVSEKYTIVQEFKLHFLHNNLLVQLHTSDSVCKSVETFLETVLWKPFQLVCRILNDICSITTFPYSQCYFNSRQHVKISWSQVRRLWGDASILLLRSLLRNTFQNWPVCWSIVVKEIPSVGSPFFGAFPTDRVPKGKKDFNVRFFIFSY